MLGVDSECTLTVVHNITTPLVALAGKMTWFLVICSENNDQWSHGRAAKRGEEWRGLLYKSGLTMSFIGVVHGKQWKLLHSQKLTNYEKKENYDKK